jgi:hypothetical protein
MKNQFNGVNCSVKFLSTYRLSVMGKAVKFVDTDTYKHSQDLNSSGGSKINTTSGMAGCLVAI